MGLPLFIKRGSISLAGLLYNQTITFPATLLSIQRTEACMHWYHFDLQQTLSLAVVRQLACRRTLTVWLAVPVWMSQLGIDGKAGFHVSSAAAIPFALTQPCITAMIVVEAWQHGAYLQCPDTKEYQQNCSCNVIKRQARARQQLIHLM